MISLTVNGKRTQLDKPVTLDRFLAERGVNSQFVAVAHNGTVLQRDEFSATTLNHGDTLEIVRPVGGG